MTSIEVRLLSLDEVDVLGEVADGVFDGPILPRWAHAFFGDAHHHMFVAIEAGVVVGMVSAVDYVHPDKAPQLWINEVGVAPTHHRRRIATRLLQAMLDHGRALGCTEAWVGTDSDNVAAQNLYASLGSSAEQFVLYSFDLSGGKQR